MYDVCVRTCVCVYLALKEHCGKGGTTIEPEDQEFYCEKMPSISDREVSCTYEISMIWSPKQDLHSDCVADIPAWVRGHTTR